MLREGAVTTPAPAMAGADARRAAVSTTPIPDRGSTRASHRRPARIRSARCRRSEAKPSGACTKRDRRRTVSRVLFHRRVASTAARIIRLGDALLRRSSALTRTPAPSLANQIRRFGRAALDGVPIRACSGRGLPRRRSPGCRAWALTPRFHPCLCLHRAPSPGARLRRPSAVWFLRRFPSSHPGSPLATSLLYGARTFLPRTVRVRRRSSVRHRSASIIMDLPARLRLATADRLDCDSESVLQLSSVSDRY